MLKKIRLVKRHLLNKRLPHLRTNDALKPEKYEFGGVISGNHTAELNNQH